MSKGFVIEFSVDVDPHRGTSDAHPRVEHIRVIISGEEVQVFRAVEGPFGEAAWAPERQAERQLMTVLAFEAFIKAPERDWSSLPNGLTLIDLGTIKRDK
jgi:hypothetical protein